MVIVSLIFCLVFCNYLLALDSDRSMQFQVIMDHREPLRDITNQPAAGRRGLKRPNAQIDTALPDDHDHGKIQVYLFAAKPHDMLSLFMMQVSFRILLYDTVLAALEANRQKARDNYAKLTDEQKAQRNAKRREAYTLKKMRAVLQRSLLMLVLSRVPKKLNTHILFI